jgi:hypothetical protein
LQTYKQFINTPPLPTNCSVPLATLNKPGDWTPLCATAQVYVPGNAAQYCPAVQPFFSAFRHAPPAADTPYLSAFTGLCFGGHDGKTGAHADEVVHLVQGAELWAWHPGADVALRGHLQLVSLPPVSVVVQEMDKPSRVLCLPVFHDESFGLQ